MNLPALSKALLSFGESGSSFLFRGRQRLLISSRSTRTSTPKIGWFSWIQRGRIAAAWTSLFQNTGRQHSIASLRVRGILILLKSTPNRKNGVGGVSLRRFDMEENDEEKGWEAPSTQQKGN